MTEQEAREFVEMLAVPEATDAHLTDCCLEAAGLRE